MCAPVSALSLAAQEESRIEEGYQPPDYVHMLIAIPPKYAVSQGGRLHDGTGCHPRITASSRPMGAHQPFRAAHICKVALATSNGRFERPQIKAPAGDI